MWRLLCITYFGAFACGAASEAYGPQITSAAQSASKLVKVLASSTLPGSHSCCEHRHDLCWHSIKVTCRTWLWFPQSYKLLSPAMTPLPGAAGPLDGAPAEPQAEGCGADGGRVGAVAECGLGHPRAGLALGRSSRPLQPQAGRGAVVLHVPGALLNKPAHVSRAASHWHRSPTCGCWMHSSPCSAALEVPALGNPLHNIMVMEISV